MADNRKRKGKVVATSSNQASPRFKTLYHESHFNSMLSARRILPELILQADEDIFAPIRYQIHNRKWEKFTKPIQAVLCNIKRVLRLKSDPYPNAPSYEERKANKDYRLEHILEDMCEEDAQWVRHRDGRPHYLRRSDLNPMSKGLESRGQEQDKQHLLNNILNNTINNHPNSNNNKTFLVSILTLTPPCHTFKGGLTSNKRKIGEASRPLTQEWTKWMTN
ncbi:hypothetical protein PIB30_106063 [Stylosanthes scabra]|uniref:Uncharacterized protein n=1 Tax=Stylosanthes scabra TaxID=79078 RepID=A0ABU6W1Y4_9FABA|nr:hypothetical protein [Stylosanthes scabra]